MLANLFRRVAAQLLQPRATETKDDPADTAPKNCSGAHRTGLRIDVKRAVSEQAAGELTRRFSKQSGLGMTGAIVGYVLGVFGFEQYSAATTDEHRAEWPVAVLARALCNHKRIT